MRSLRNPLKLSVACLSLALLPNCAGNTVPVVDTAKVCQVWKQIDQCPADKLTDETANRILQNNEGRIAFSCQKPDPRIKPACPAPAKVAAN